MRAIVDPRITGDGTLSWTRNRLTLFSTLSTTRSLPGSAIALQTFGWTEGAMYRIVSDLYGETGIRGAYYVAEGVDSLPPDWTAYIAMSYALTIAHL